MTRVTLEIAGIRFDLVSRFPRGVLEERLKNFIVPFGGRRPDVTIEVEVARRWPDFPKGRTRYVTIHPDNNEENWRLRQVGRRFVYTSSLERKEICVVIDASWKRLRAYLKPHPEQGDVWHVHDIVYDFLQVFIINYLARSRSGFIVHSVGLKDADGRGLLFVGKSGAGKTTTARFWYRHTRAMILNDDRVIVRRIQGRHFIFGSPWHGDFRDYLWRRIEAAPLRRLFFIHHGARHRIEACAPAEAFRRLYPALFPAFWEPESVAGLAGMAGDLVKEVPCARLGFAKNRSVIPFVRGAS